MRFIRFNFDDFGDAIFPVECIDYVILYDKHYEEEATFGEFKILVFINDEDKGMAECFYYENEDEMIEARNKARARFSEILELLNG